jgi:hypothetical protein
VLLALNRAVAFDYQRSDFVGGFAASHGTWLLVVGAGLLALLGVFARRVPLGVAAIANAAAAVSVALAIGWTVHATPGRVDPATGCENQNIGLGCGIHRALDVLESAPRDHTPSRTWLVLALGAYLVASASAVQGARVSR